MFNRRTLRKIFAPRRQGAKKILILFSELGILCAFARVIFFPISKPNAMANRMNSIKIFAPRRQGCKEQDFLLSVNLAHFAPLREASYSRIRSPNLNRNFQIPLAKHFERWAVMDERSPTGSSLGSMLSAFIGSW